MAVIGDRMIEVSAGDAAVLRKHRDERPRFVSLGVALLVGGIFAATSMTFAMRQAFGAGTAVAVVVGVLWGVAIANLDRLLITMVRRTGAWWRTLGLALTRLAMAVLLGTAVSFPLVLQVFDREIQVELTSMQQEEKAAAQRRLNEDPRFERIPELEAQVEELRTQRAPNAPVDVSSDPEVRRLEALVREREQIFRAAEAAVVCENEGTCGSNRQGRGPAYREKVRIQQRTWADLDEARGDLADARRAARRQQRGNAADRREQAERRLPAVEKELAALTSARSAELDVAVGKASLNDGMAARLTALLRLSDEHPAVLFFHVLIALVLIAIECMAVIAKTFMTLGPPSVYDEVVRIKEETEVELARGRAMVEEAKARTERAVEIHRSERGAAAVLADIDQDERKRELERQAELEAHAELVAKVKDEYVEQAKLDVECNLDRYIVLPGSEAPTASP